MPLLSPGVALHYEMADFDVCDLYCFVLQSTDDGLAFTSAMGSGEDDDVYEEGEPVHMPSTVLTDARAVAVLSQGSWLNANLEYPELDEATGAITLINLPPFLVSRAVLRELRAGGTRLRSEWAAEGADPAPLTLTKRTTATIERDGETIEVDVLVAAGDEMTLMIVDDDDYPLVIERVEGDNFWRLQKIDHDSCTDDDDDEGEQDDPQQRLLS